MKRTELVFLTAAAALMLVMLAYVTALLVVVASETDAFFEVTLALLIGGLLIGLAVLWGLCCYRQSVREEIIKEARAALSDVLKNRLTVITLHVQRYQRQRNRTSLEQAKVEIGETASWIDSFSAVTIEEWKDRYEETTPGKGETTRSKRPGDRRWMLRWLAREKPFHYGRRGLSPLECLRLVWWGLRGGRPLQKFRESIRDGRGLVASYMIARRAARLLG